MPRGKYTPKKVSEPFGKGQLPECVGPRHNLELLQSLMNYYKEHFMLISEEGMYEIIDEITFHKKKLLQADEIVNTYLSTTIK